MAQSKMIGIEQQYEAFIDAFSGATGGVIAQLLLWPLENFRTRMQTMKQDQQRIIDEGDTPNDDLNSIKKS